MSPCSSFPSLLLLFDNFILLPSLALFPGLPMFFNVHEKNQEGLVDVGDIMDMVCDDEHWNE